MTLPLEQELTLTNFTKELTEILDNLDRDAFYQWVRSNALDTNALGHFALVGYLRAVRAVNEKQFDWAMYLLCYAKGFEEIVAAFWITNYMMKLGEIQEGLE